MKYKELTKSYDLLTVYTKEYETLFERERINTHEFNNQLITISTLKTKKEIKDYINKIYVNQDMHAFNYSELQHISNYTLKWFLHQKLVDAKNKNIKVTLFVSRSTKKIKIPKSDTEEFRDLFRLLGIFLDNAIENAAYSEEKEINIDLDYSKNILYIIIENTFSNNIKKGKDRGFGLKIAKLILENHKIFEFNTSIQDELFKQELIINF